MVRNNQRGVIFTGLLLFVVIVGLFVVAWWRFHHQSVTSSTSPAQSVPTQP